MCHICSMPLRAQQFLKTQWRHLCCHVWQVLDHRINALLHAGRAVLVVGDLNIAGTQAARFFRLATLHPVSCLRDFGSGAM